MVGDIGLYVWFVFGFYYRFLKLYDLSRTLVDVRDCMRYWASGTIFSSFFVESVAAVDDVCYGTLQEVFIFATSCFVFYKLTAVMAHSILPGLKILLDLALFLVSVQSQYRGGWNYYLEKSQQIFAAVLAMYILSSVLRRR